MSRQWLEKELEEYTCTHLEEFWEEVYDMPGEGHNQCFLLGRQIPTSAGIIDALVLVNSELFIVEFKATKATQKDLGQLQRYRAALISVRPEQLLRKYELPDSAYFNIAITYLESFKLVLIAPDFTGEALIGADLCVRATREEGCFYYEDVSIPRAHGGNNPALEELLGYHMEKLVSDQRYYMAAASSQTLLKSAKESADFSN